MIASVEWPGDGEGLLLHSDGWAIAQLTGHNGLEITILGALDGIRVPEAVPASVHDDFVYMASVTVSHSGFGGRDPLSVSFADDLNRASRIELVADLARAARTP